MRGTWQAWRASRRLDRLLPLLFVILALPLTIFIALAAPPGQAPDETAHVIRAASLLHGQFVGHRAPPVLVNGHREPQVAIRADMSTANVTWSGTTTRQYYGAAVRAKLGAIRWTGRSIEASVPNTAVYPPFLYIPAALALAAMRLLGASPFQAFLAERVADALSYATLGALALVLARRGKTLLFAVLLLPTALWLAGMVHPDGVMIGLTALSVALLTGAEISRARIWIAAVAFSLVVLARPPLLPMALLIALPLGLRRSLGPLAIGVVPGLIWMLVVMPLLSVPFHTDPYRGGPLWEGDPTRVFFSTDTAIQARILLSHPGRLFTIPLATMLQTGGRRISEIFRVAGALNLVLPDFIGALGAIALLAAIAGLGRDPAHRHLKWIIAAAAATIWLIYDAEYVSWTHVGDMLVEGVQGRYFLELPLFLALAGAARPQPAIWAAPALTLAFCSIAAVPMVVIAAYYVK